MIDVESIKSQFDLREIMGGDVILCPYHSERTPSCRVNQKGFKCFGCGKRGDIISITMEQKGFSFKEALRHLTSDKNLEFSQNPCKKDRNYSEYNAEFIDQAIRVNRLCFQFLSNLEKPKLVSDYAEDRGIRDYGFISSKDQDALIQALINHSGHNINALREYGLINNKDKFPFTNRIVIPLYAPLTKHILGFTARLVPGLLTPDLEKLLPKYINTATNDAFQKERYLFNIQEGSGVMVYVVEGQVDALTASKQGYPAIALGTSRATDKQIDQLLYYYKKRRIVLILDGDKAGLSGGLSIANQLLQCGKNADIMLLNKGEDPHSVIKSGKKSLLSYPFYSNSWLIMDKISSLALADTPKIKYDRSEMDEIFRPFVMDNIKNGWPHLNILDYVCKAFPEYAKDIQTALKGLVNDTLENEDGSRKFRTAQIKNLLKAWKKPCKALRELHGQQSSQGSKG